MEDKPKKEPKKKGDFSIFNSFHCYQEAGKEAESSPFSFLSPSLVNFSLLARFASLMERDSLLALGYKISWYSSVNSLFIEPDYVSYSKKFGTVS